MNSWRSTASTSDVLAIDFDVITGATAWMLVMNERGQVVNIYPAAVNMEPHGGLGQMDARLMFDGLRAYLPEPAPEQAPRVVRAYDAAPHRPFWARERATARPPARGWHTGTWR